MAMKICLTNDDGIFAEGMMVLANWAKTLGDVTIVAPKTQQSGKAHSIELHDAFEVQQVEHPSGLRAFSVDSTPADCVRVALIGLNETYDLIVSGVNCGYNLGREIIYSGTVGAALEASVHGVNGIAVSTGFDTFKGAVACLDKAWDYIEQHKLLDKNLVWNVNIPEEPEGGIRLTRQGGRYFSDDFTWDGNKIKATGKCVWTPSDDEHIDTNAVLLHRQISITPIGNDRTSWKVLDELNI